MEEKQPLLADGAVKPSDSYSSQYSIDGSDNPAPLNGPSLEDARWLLCLSHFFNQFSEQTWQFCLALFLAAFTNNQSLILVTSYGLVTNLFVSFFGSSIGRYIDGSNRLILARQFIGLENFAVVTATGLCYILLSRDHDLIVGNDLAARAATEESIYDLKSVSLLVGIHLLGALAMILDSGFLVAVERDWIVVMSLGACEIQKSKRVLRREEEESVQQTWLSDTNVKMRQIDLSCKILAPAIGGILIAFFDDGMNQNHGYDLRGATLVVGGVNVLALIVEYICTAKIYYEIPALGMKAIGEKTAELGGEEGQNMTDGDTRNGRGSMKILDDLKVFFDQSICWAGFALSLLYLNVALTFGNIMTVYLVWRGISMNSIGLWRGVANVAGLGGTFVYHFMANEQKVGLVNIGMISVTFQFLCLCACYLSLFVDDNQMFFIMFVGGVCFSRIGLWVFDISVTQLMQLHVPPPIRGLVGGVQQSMNSFFTVVIYVVGLFLSDPSNFYIYALVSFAGVIFAAVFYGTMVFARKGKFRFGNDGNGAISV